MRFVLSLCVAAMVGSATGAVQADAAGAEKTLVIADDPEGPPDPSAASASYPCDEPHGDDKKLCKAIIYGAGALAFVGAVATFSAYDGVVAHDGELPSLDWAIAETSVTTPAALVLQLGTNVMDTDRSSAKDIAKASVLLPVAAWTTGLATHGVWSTAALASDARPDPEGLVGVSLIVGTNTTLTTAALSRAFGERWHRPALATAAMVGSAPSIAVGAYEAATAEHDRPGWIALTAWSGALFAHGACSLALSLLGGSERRTAPPRTASVSLAPSALIDHRGAVPAVVLAGSF